MNDQRTDNDFGSSRETAPVAGELVLSQLSQICKSAEFSGSTRLQDFLTYVVNESVDGRGDAIRGKTIAMDVYGRDQNSAGDTANVVRVDAGRLRRKLDEYYSNSGEFDPIRIYIDPGTYAPRFDNVGSTGANIVANGNSIGFGMRVVWLTLLLAVIAAVLLLTWQMRGQQQSEQASPVEGVKTIERQAVFDKSPASLQAFNLSEQARDLIFPAADVHRVTAARNMFEQATALDPDYFGGFAGLAQTIATQAALKPPGEERLKLLVEAKTHAERAIQLNPANGWSQSAKAWVAFVGRDNQAANELSKRAVELATRDLHVLEFDALIALFSGDFDRVLLSSDPIRHKERANSRFVFLSAYASAKFHKGHYRETIDLFTANIAEGGLVSPITIAYLAAANQQDQQFEAAKILVRQFNESWPGIRIDLLLTSLFEDPSHAKQVIEPLRQAGWSPTDN